MSSRWLIVVGVAASAAVLATSVIPVVFLPTETSSWLQNLANLGQFIEGIFAPVAFVWVIIAVLLQSRELELQRLELANSRRALELQYEELKKTVEQHVEQTRLMQRESELRRIEIETTSLEDRILEVCSQLLSIHASLEITNHDPGEWPGVIFSLGNFDGLKAFFYERNYVAFLDTVWRSVGSFLELEKEASLAKVARSYRGDGPAYNKLGIVVQSFRDIEIASENNDKVRGAFLATNFMMIVWTLERLEHAIGLIKLASEKNQT